MKKANKDSVCCCNKVKCKASNKLIKQDCGSADFELLAKPICRLSKPFAKRTLLQLSARKNLEEG
ncbi:hypothetical protein GmHk_11G032854 [Glycine max]|nr:hypothetical protein GmHk_11G032854 [Glycine max]